MLSHCVVLVIACVVTLQGDRTLAATPCSITVDKTMEVSLSSYKDSTGRWVAQVDMEHDGDENDSRPWKIDIQHKPVGCPGSSKVRITAKFTPPPPKPGPGYELHRGLGYYKFHTKKKTWQEAKVICESEGAHLVIFNSEAESNALKEMYLHFPQNETGTWIFVGFHDMYTEGRYLTVFDEPMATTGFSRWSSQSQPDNYGGSESNPGEDCGSINRNNGGLNDLICTGQAPFLCEAGLD